MSMTKPVKLPKWAVHWIEKKEASGQLAPMSEYGCKVHAADKPKKKQRITKKEHGGSSYKWYSGLKKQMNKGTPTQWFEEAEINGVLDGKGLYAKRLRQLAKNDQRKLRNVTEKREEVREQLGSDLWRHGITRLATVGKPRGVKKQIIALPENLPSNSAITE
jgi:hypothetical protein